ncbi:hypothetical protein CYMTET_43832 [Cymbomonas tetramitiformis]|uniref:Uncharacterized protein n=1 Tax=Cymbomonas tetramitiformis TaxID=36881 RepID=A0AAE0EZL0_9CHLO|nr:hypothetical protein CYMTET_43832 [Cymbomonas tetramitiformis]
MGCGNSKVAPDAPNLNAETSKGGGDASQQKYDSEFKVSDLDDMIQGLSNKSKQAKDATKGMLHTPRSFRRCSSAGGVLEDVSRGSRLGWGRGCLEL